MSGGPCGALLALLRPQSAKSIQQVSSWTALRGPFETPNLRKFGRSRPSASQNWCQNFMSKKCPKKLHENGEKVSFYWTLDVLQT